LSQDPVESFRMFQGKVLDEYSRMAPDYDFQVIDGTRSINSQQQKVREIVARLYERRRLSESK
jgi:dTMP kinase